MLSHTMNAVSVSIGSASISHKFTTLPLLRVSKFGRQSEHLLEIVHAKFQVNAAIFAAVRLNKGIFAVFCSILPTEIAVLT